MTILIERDDDQIIMTAPMVSKDKAKEIPGGRFDSKARVWRYPLSWTTCVVARGVFGQELEVGPELKAWAQEEFRTRIQPALEAREAKV